jgi:predicted nucleic acid-binding protein
VDTGAFVAVMRKKDRHHEAARNFIASPPPLVTSDYVVDETVTLLLTRVGRDAAERFLGSIRSSRLLRLEMVGKDGFSQAESLFLHYKDKEWSFTDCTSFAVAKRLGVEEVFGFDHHFEQMGLRQVPK